MESMSRRVLLTSGITGLVAAALPEIRATAAKPRDEVGDHILNEARRLAHQAQSRVRPHETMTAFATNLRLHAAHIRSTGQDILIADAVARHVRKHGRQALLDAAHSPAAMQRHMDQLHAEGLDDLMIPESPSTPEQADQALTSLMIPGTLAANMERMADAIDHASERVALSGQPHVVLAQDIGGFCQVMASLCNVLKLATAIICAISAAGGPEFAPICVVIGVEAAAACFWAWDCS
jgi:hypothetical protein